MLKIQLQHDPDLTPEQLQEPDTGLYYLRARDYDPASGRFLQPDP
jgi:RHS repeat-associated protein